MYLLNTLLKKTLHFFDFAGVKNIGLLCCSAHLYIAGS
ncbi:hypothetical protein GNIT_3636 [Glaciecola nitratireducens FR1064]|uniref:Uncharacterized protein n=1 Tax=Glaciecola nitratireducens (strain JCM 12485 / KCTC 12276 / FR1064) TaxID=1085623 RepID=G4QP22_GLANF|nr:hypothetical protein GNIT_3636 [Glaciecola nitratireducens FR1064]